MVFAVVLIGFVMFLVISHFRSLAPAPEKIVHPAPDVPDLDSIFSDNSVQELEIPGEEASLEFVKAALSNRDPGRMTAFSSSPGTKPRTTPSASSWESGIAKEPFRKRTGSAPLLQTAPS